MPGPAHTGNIGVNPNLDGYQGPTESSGVQGGTSGVAGFIPALPASGETTYDTVNSGPSIDQLAAAKAEAEQRANEMKRRANDQSIAKEALNNQSDKKRDIRSEQKSSTLKAEVKKAPQQSQQPELAPNIKRSNIAPKSAAIQDETNISNDISEKKKRQKRKREQVDYFSQAQQTTAKKKQFKQESKPKLPPNPARDVDTKRPHGPIPTVTPEGIVGIGEQRNVTEMPLPYGGELPVTAIVKANLDNTGLVLSDKVNKELETDPNRPWKTEGPTRPWMASQWGVASQNLLPGQIGDYNYVSNRQQNDKRKEEDIIDESIKKQAENADINQRYPNAVDTSLDYVTYEKFTEEYNQGVGENGEDLRARGRYKDSMLSRAMARMKKNVNRIVQWYHQAYIPLESEHIDDSGNIRYSPDVETAIVNYMNYMGFAPEERYVVMQQAIKALGLTPDRDGLFFNRSEREKISDQIFIEALNNMMVSCSDDNYGHPYGFINRGMFLGGTRCYPVGVMTLHEAQILCKPGHIFEGQDPYALMSKAAETWLNETLPNIRKNIYRQENGEAQMVVLEDFVRALCSLDNISPRKFGVADVVDRGYEQMVSETVPGYKLNEDKDDIAVNNMRRRQLDLARRRFERSFDRLDRVRNRVYQVYDEDVVSDSGEILHRKGDKVSKSDERNLARTRYIRNPKANAFSSVCMSVANMAKFAGVVGYVPIMASGVIEHAQGNVNTKVANGILFGTNQAYKPNDAMYAHVTSEAGVEAIQAWKALIHAGGQDALTMYYAEYKVLNKENAKKFIEDYVKREGSKALPARKLKELMSRAEEAVSWLMPGDIGFGKADARRWLECFMLNNMYNSNDELGLEHSFDSQQVLEMMNAMGIERFLAAATEMNAGRDAMVMARNQTFDRISPITYIVDSILRRNGVTNMFVTLGIDTYFTYGLNLVQMMIPFSNTFSYLSVKGINMLATGGRNNTDKLDLNILNYQMGGNDEFGIGLKKNVIYDCVKLGNICLISGFMYFVIAALGFDEPEDPMNKYVWSEYRIGKNINLGGNDENGNPTGIPIYAAWWLNDLTMFAMPMAYALHASQIEQKLGDNDPDLANKLFFSGCHDMLSGCSLLDLMKAVNNARSDFEYYEQMMQDPDMECPPDWFSFGALQAELWCARGVNKFVPNALKSLRTDTLIVGENAFDHTAYKVYDRNSKTPGKTEYVDDWFEVQRRIESKYNPIYALYNNLTKNGYLLDDGSTEKTGYLFDEMPISTTKDPLRMYWAHKYDFDPNNIPGGEDNRIPYTESLMDQVLVDIDSFNSPEEALAQGYMIPAALRYEMRDYCYQHINFEENLFNEKLQSGWLPTADYQEAKAQMRNNQQYWYDILNNWIFNKDIPWTDEGYAKLITSNQDVYYYKDSGKPATKFDYWELGPETVEQRYVPRGDHPVSFVPFTTPDPRGRGYNYETISNWYKEGESGSNLEAIYNQMKEEQATVPYGRDAGVFVNTAIFGGDPNFKTNELIESDEYRAMNQPTMGYRAYVPWETEFLDDLKNVTRKDVDDISSMGDMGKYKDKEKWSTSTYPSYYSTGSAWPSGGRWSYGGGSNSDNYNPKIYSNPRSVNADRAATMYTKQPQSARTDYLHPSFSTKGSREAYKRQDI